MESPLMLRWRLWSHLRCRGEVNGVAWDVEVGFIDSPRMSGRGLWSHFGCLGGMDYGVTSDIEVRFMESPRMLGWGFWVTSDVLPSGFLSY